MCVCVCAHACAYTCITSDQGTDIVLNTGDADTVRTPGDLGNLDLCRASHYNVRCAVVNACGRQRIKAQVEGASRESPVGT